MSELCLFSQPSGKHIKVANGANALRSGSFHQIPTSLGGLIVNLDIVVVKGGPFDLTIAIKTIEELNA